jgi:hypothetical protein
MSPMQQIFLGLGAVAKKTYVDDIFSTFLYTGDATARSINTGIDMTEGGLVWIKNRDQAYNHSLQDTVRGAGATKKISSNLNNAENSGDTANHWAGYISAFNNNGFSIDKTGSGSIDWANYNKSGEDYTAWTFRKSPAFTIKQYTGSGSTQSISHDLGSIPGMIMVKRTDSSAGWAVYHRGVDGTSPENYALGLDNTDARSESANYWNDTAPTATHFTVKTSGSTNTSGATYIAYIFAGGKSTAATARSVDFDGTGNWDRRLGIADSSDFTVGTNFTAECWYKCRSTPYSGIHHIMGQWDGNSSDAKNSWSLQHYNNQLRFYWIGDGSMSYKSMGNITKKAWHHFAFSKSGSTTRLFVDGVQMVIDFDTGSIQDGTGKFTIGACDGGSGDFDGQVSNVRVVNGTAVYTSSFQVPKEPLANITNTKLLCCNNSSITGSTVTPGTITAYNSPTASTDSPFDDPAGFVGGEAGDQNLIKCGSIDKFNGALGEVYLGFEPQWVLIKRTDAASDWFIIDSMRGTPSGAYSSANGRYLKTNLNGAESTNMSSNGFELTATGFKNSDVGDAPYGAGNNFIYIAIRRPDGYVGKPIELGTDVFNIDLAGINAGDPSWVSGFPVDMQFIKDRAGTTYDWFLSTRLTQGKYLSTTSTAAETANSVYSHDYQNGWGNYSSSDAELITSWMWKRHAGFDVVPRKGLHVQYDQAHSLGQVPEMIWAKIRNNTEDWAVYHKGLNGGTNPEQYRLTLNSDGSQASSSTAWANKAPTSTHFFIGNDPDTNGTNDLYIYMLFASVSGISSVGSYSGSSSDKTISLDFQPRLFICKAYNSSGVSVKWNVFDSARGISGASTKRMFLNTDGTQQTGSYVTSVSSSGITLAGGFSHSNSSGNNYIYYAHA